MTSVTRPFMPLDRTGQKQNSSNVYSQLSGVEDVTGFQWFHQGWFYSRRWSSSHISSVSFPEPGVSVRSRRSKDSEDSDRVEWVWCSWNIGWDKCDSGMSAENVSVVVNIKILKGRFVEQKLSTGWPVSVVKSVEKKKRVVDQFSASLCRK
jgi:hypothetical protein